MEPPWHPAGHQMATKIGQAAPKCSKNLVHALTFRQLARPKGTRGHPKHPHDDLYRFCLDLGSIFHEFGTLQTLFNDFGQVSASICCIVFTRRQEPPRTSKEPAKNQAHSELLKTWSSKLQFAERRQPPTNAFYKRHLPQTGSGGVTPHGAFNPLQASAAPRACLTGTLDSLPLDFTFLGFPFWFSHFLDSSFGFLPFYGFCIRIVY